MNDTEIKAKLKRMCPYRGALIPEKVRQNALGLWDADDPKGGHWRWDCGSGTYQCELLVCDLDNHQTVDPAGYVAIVPLEHGRARLKFVLMRWHTGSPISFDCPIFENIIFASMQEAKRLLDGLLAATTPEIPPDENHDLDPDMEAAFGLDDD